MEIPDAMRDGPRPVAHPLSLRPSRLPLLWAVPLLVVIAVAMVRGLGQVQLMVMFTALTLVAVYVTVMILKLLRGRTEADAEGIRDRLAFRTTTMAWGDVRGMSVMPTLMGRIVIVHGTDGRRFSLAAPRAGLLARGPRFDDTLRTMTALAAPRDLKPSRPATRPIRFVYWALITVFATAAVVLWRPWLDPWWPGRDEAAALPPACAVADSATARGLVSGAERSRGDHDDLTHTVSTDCRYRGPEDGELLLEMDLDKRTGWDGGIEKARDGYAEAERIAVRSAGRLDAEKDWAVTMADMPGLGDQAWRSVGVDAREGGVEIRLVVRRGNAIIKIDYAARRPRDEAVAAVDALARKALGRIEFR